MLKLAGRCRGGNSLPSAFAHEWSTAKVILSNPSGHVAERLEDVGDGRIFRAQSDRHGTSTGYAGESHIAYPRRSGDPIGARPFCRAVDVPPG